MALDQASVVANEMERVRPNVPTLFERDDTFYGTVEKRDVEVVSKRDMRIPLELRPGGLFGYFDSDGGDMGLGTGPTFDKAVINTNDFKMAVQWTAQAEWATDDARKAVLNTFRHLLAKAMAEFRANVDKNVMSDGTGVLATVSGVSTSGGKDTVTCNLAGNGFGVRLLRDGGSYSVYDTTLATRRVFTGAPSYVPAGEAPIELYDLANKQVKFTGTTGATVSGDKIVASGLTATPPVGIFGVPYHHNAASTGFWLGLDRSTIPQIRANQVAAAGGLSLPLPRLAINKIGDRVGINNIEQAAAWMHPCQKQAYEQLGQLVSVIYKEAKEEGLNLYFNDNMQLAGAPVKCSYNWDKTRIDFVVASVWGRAEMHPAGFYTNNDGRRIFEIRGASGGVAASSIFYIVASFNMFVNNPAVCSYISGLTIPTGY